MTTVHHAPRLPLAAILAALAVFATLTTASIAHANTPPVKLDLSSHIGWEVNKTTKANLCTITSENECQHATPTSKAGGFRSPIGVAAIPKGLPGENNIYVTDIEDARVQELTPTGELVEMFGKNVNGKGADTCTKTEETNCTAGEPGTEAGSFIAPESITVNPTNGNWYVIDYSNWRVDEYTPAGAFVLTIGKEVNETRVNTPSATESEKNLCTATSKDTCKAGVQGTIDSTEKSAFEFAASTGDLLSVSGSEHLLYVGDAHRVQIFSEDGEWKSEIPLPATITENNPEGHITDIAVGDNTVYVVYDSEPVVHEYNAETGIELPSKIENPARETGKPAHIEALALDPLGHLAVWATENVPEGPFTATQSYGTLYDALDGQLLTEFTTPGLSGAIESHGASGIGFDDEGNLYAVLSSDEELWSYVPVPVAELTAGAPGCSPGLENGSDVTIGCTLAGEANPEGVAGTEVFFELGRTGAFGEVTAKQPVGSVRTVSAGVQGLLPDETYYDRLAGEDENARAPELLTSRTVSFVTPSVAPKILGAPDVSFLTSFSAVFSAGLNPENADTTYEFQYGACEDLDACPGALRTRTLESSAYGQTTAILEARDLKPATEYHYRLLANNQHVVAGKPEGGAATGAVGTFTTGPAPVLQAFSGLASGVGTTSAAISGSVNPDGQPAVYTFEAGLYEGAATQYGVVFTATVGAATTVVPEEVGLSGLQPGATYAYRIKLTSGYGAAYGETLTFTTQGLPAVLTVPATPMLLAVPAIVFPAEVRVSAIKASPKKKTKKKKKKKVGKKGKARKAVVAPMQGRSHQAKAL